MLAMQFGAGPGCQQGDQGLCGVRGLDRPAVQHRHDANELPRPVEQRGSKVGVDAHFRQQTIFGKQLRHSRWEIADGRLSDLGAGCTRQLVLEIGRERALRIDGQGLDGAGVGHLADQGVVHAQNPREIRHHGLEGRFIATRRSHGRHGLQRLEGAIVVGPVYDQRVERVRDAAAVTFDVTQQLRPPQHAVVAPHAMVEVDRPAFNGARDRAAQPIAIGGMQPAQVVLQGLVPLAGRRRKDAGFSFVPLNDLGVEIERPHPDAR